MARVRAVELHEVPADLQPIYRRYTETYGPFLFNEALGIEIEDGVVEDMLASGVKRADLPHPETPAVDGA